MMGLNSFIQFLLISGQHIKIHFRSRRHGFNQVFQRIFIYSAPQIQKQRRFFSICQKQRVIVALFEIFIYGLDN